MYYNGTLSQWCNLEKGEENGDLPWLGIGLDNYDLYLLNEEDEYYPVISLNFDGIENIRPISFYGCKCLQEVTLHNVELGEQAFDKCSNLNTVNLHGKVEFISSFYTSPFDQENSDLEIRIYETAANVMDYETVLYLLEYADHCKITNMKTGDDLSENWDVIEDLWTDGYATLADVIKLIDKEIDAQTDFGYLEDIVQENYDEELYGENEEDVVEGTESRAVLTDVEGVINFESYDDLYKFYEYICLTEKLFLPYRKEIENTLSNCKKLSASYRYDLFADRQLEKLIESIKSTICAFEDCKGKSATIYHIIEGSIQDILDASDRASEDTAFSIIDIDYDEKLLEPLSAIAHSIEIMGQSLFLWDRCYPR